MIDDAAEFIESKNSKIPVRMINGVGYFDYRGYEFTQESPIQLIPASEAYRLVQSNPSRFVIMTEEDIKRYYNLL